MCVIRVEGVIRLWGLGRAVGVWMEAALCRAEGVVREASVQGC